MGGAGLLGQGAAWQGLGHPELQVGRKKTKLLALAAPHLPAGIPRAPFHAVKSVCTCAWVSASPCAYVERMLN